MNMREQFEAWAEPELYALDKRKDSDVYRNVITRNAWFGWQAALAAQAKRIAELEDDLQFVERWANHHAAHPNISAKEALSVIQHYPSIEEITKSYKDGAIPDTRNPYAEIEALRKQVEELKAESVKDSRTIRQLKDALSAYGAPDIFADED